MKSNIYIEATCVIADSSIMLNDEVVIQSEHSIFKEFAKDAYSKLNIGYPKFFKMDNLSKLAFLGAEVLLGKPTESKPTDIAVIFANSSSSLDTDMHFQSSINDKENFFPSPAVFVYTLPNICIGEICIRHQLKSEQCFFIFEVPNQQMLRQYASVLLMTGKATKALCGWVELFEENYRAEMFLLVNK